MLKKSTRHVILVTFILITFWFFGLVPFFQGERKEVVLDNGWTKISDNLRIEDIYFDHSYNDLWVEYFSQEIGKISSPYQIPGNKFPTESKLQLDYEIPNLCVGEEVFAHVPHEDLVLHYEPVQSTWTQIQTPRIDVQNYDCWVLSHILILELEGDYFRLDNTNWDKLQFTGISTANSTPTIFISQGINDGIWAFLESGEVYLYQTEHERWELIFSMNQGISKVVVTDNNAFWVVDSDNSLFQVAEEGQYKPILITNSFDERILNAAEDTQGSTWLVTNRRVLRYYEGNLTQIALPSETEKHILGEAYDYSRHAIWIYTDSGLYYLDVNILSSD